VIAITLALGKLVRPLSRNSLVDICLGVNVNFTKDELHGQEENKGVKKQMVNVVAVWSDLLVNPTR
jgi:hypothetical protein